MTPLSLSKLKELCDEARLAKDSARVGITYCMTHEPEKSESYSRRWMDSCIDLYLKQHLYTSAILATKTGEVLDEKWLKKYKEQLIKTIEGLV